MGRVVGVDVVGRDAADAGGRAATRAGGPEVVVDHRGTKGLGAAVGGVRPVLPDLGQPLWQGFLARLKALEAEIQRELLELEGMLG